MPISRKLSIKDSPSYEDIFETPIHREIERVAEKFIAKHGSLPIFLFISDADLRILVSPHRDRDRKAREKIIQEDGNSRVADIMYPLTWVEQVESMWDIEKVVAYELWDLKRQRPYLVKVVRRDGPIEVS